MTNLPKAIKLILAVLLLLCLADMPYGYYQFVRLASLIAFGFLAYDAYGGNKIGETILFCALCLLFQPLEKIALGRFLWNVIDFLVALYLVGSAFLNTAAKKS
jgi:hypothetical protein